MSHKKSSTPPHLVLEYHVRCSGTGRIPPTYAAVPPPRSTGWYWGPLTGRGREYFCRVAPTAASTRVDSGERAAPGACIEEERGDGLGARSQSLAEGTAALMVGDARVRLGIEQLTNRLEVPTTACQGERSVALVVPPRRRPMLEQDGNDGSVARRRRRRERGTPRRVLGSFELTRSHQPIDDGEVPRPSRAEQCRRALAVVRRRRRAPAT